MFSKISVTISVGVAQYKNAMKEPEELYRCVLIRLCTLQKKAAETGWL